jgi:hypothetical protein
VATRIRTGLVSGGLLRKVGVIQRELGSLGAVLFDQIESNLENGLTSKVKNRIEAIFRER